MAISKGKLGAFGVILGGLAQILAALGSGHGLTSPEVLQGGTAVVTGVGLLGIRGKQERTDPGT